MNVLDQMKHRMDSWINHKTGLGGSKDNTRGTHINFCRMTQIAEEHMYAGDDIAAKIVDVLPEDMQRKGWSYQTEDKDSNIEINKYFHSEFKRLSLYKKIDEAMKVARLHGGSGILLGIKDGRSDDQEVNYGSIREIEYARVFDRYDLQPAVIEDKLESNNYKKPRTYKISGVSGEFHHSRIILFHGNFLPRRQFEQNNYCHDSVLNKTRDSIAGYSATMQGLLSSMPEIYLNIYKVKGLSKLVAENKLDLLAKRMQMIDAKKSLFNALVVDADGEEISRDKLDLSDIPGILDKIEKRIAASADMPHTKIFGDGASGGLTKTGDSELKEWYDQVARKQKVVLTPALEQICKIIKSQKSSKFKDIGIIEIVYEALYELTKLQMADVRLKTSQADNLDYTNGILTAEEIAVSRYGSGQYSTETQLLEDSRPVENDLNDE